jgi:hypothetical protein
MLPVLNLDVILAFLLYICVLGAVVRARLGALNGLVKVS